MLDSTGIAHSFNVLLMLVGDYLAVSGLIVWLYIKTTKPK